MSAIAQPGRWKLELVSIGGGGGEVSAMRYFFFDVKKQIMHPWVVASSSLFFVPAFIALGRQNVVVAIVLMASSLFSLLYHINDERAYEELDVIWASLAVLIALLLLCVLLTRYVPWHPRVALPLAFGLAGLLVYFLEGQSTGTGGTDSNHYELYHSLWHFFVALSATALVWTPVQMSELNFTFYDMLGKSASQIRGQSA